LTEAVAIAIYSTYSYPPLQSLFSPSRCLRIPL
jgi:hypothetical protein